MLYVHHVRVWLGESASPSPPNHLPAGLDSMAMTKGSPGPITRTKVRTPLLRSDLITRPRLIEAFERGHEPALTLVSGPAGSGKTTAVLQWLANSGSLAAWVSLDPDDDEPRTFWRLIAASFRELGHEILNETVTLLDAPGADLAKTTVPTLINELLDLERPIVLVIDDIHNIESVQILEQLQVLISRRPPMLRVIATTSRAVALPLARWRAHRDLVEIESNHLAFDSDDARRLVTSISPTIDDATIARIHQETEGWITGLHLAATDRTRTALSQPVDDYLLDATLEEESSNVVDFLIEVSILSELNSPACAAVTGRDESLDLLRAHARRNLFLFEIDSPEPAWRFHSLVRGALQTKLRERRTRSQINELHHRAASWAQGLGDWKMAVRHLRAAGDVDGAVALLESSWLLALNQGEFEQFERATNDLPGDAIDDRPALWIGMAFASLNLGQLEKARQRADRCERIGRNSQALGLALVRCHYQRHVGDVAAACRAARIALAASAKSDDAGIAGAEAALGECLFWLRDQEAVSHLERAISLGQTSQEHFSVLAGHSYLAAWWAENDQEDRARIHLEEANGSAQTSGLHQGHHFAMGFLAEGWLAAKVDDYPTAEQALESAITLARQGQEPLTQISGWLSLAQLRYRAGDQRGAESSIQEAKLVHDACVAPGRLTSDLDVASAAITQPRPSAARSALIAPLTERELSMLRLLRSELTQREIATHLFISFNTARTHTKAIYRKLGVNSRAEALAVADTHGLI